MQSDRYDSGAHRSYQPTRPVRVSSLPLGTYSAWWCSTPLNSSIPAMSGSSLELAASAPNEVFSGAPPPVTFGQHAIAFPPVCPR